MDAIKHIYTHLSLRGNQILGLRPQVAEEDPEFLEGGIYYNSATKTFMGGSDGKWAPFGVPQEIDLSIYATKTDVDNKVKVLADKIAVLEGLWYLDNGILCTDHPIASKGYAAGATATASEGGSGVGIILTTWDGYDSTKAGYALGAGLGKEMYDRITVLEDAGYATQSWVEGKGYLLASTAESTYQKIISASNKIPYSYISGTPTSLKSPYALTINNSAGTAQVSYDGSETKSLTLTKAMLGLGSVENTALSTWAGSTNITTLGTITSGVWNGSKIKNSFLEFYYVTIADTKVLLGGSISTDTLKTNLGLGSYATTAYVDGTFIKGIIPDYTKTHDYIKPYAGKEGTYGSFGVDLVIRDDIAGASEETDTSLSSGVFNNGLVTALGVKNYVTSRGYQLSSGLGALAYKNSLVASDIPSLDWSKITSGKPTTLAGYGITDAYTVSTIDSKLAGYLPLTGGTLTGGLTISAGHLIVSGNHTITNELYSRADNTYDLGNASRRWKNLYTVAINGGTPIQSNNIGDYALTYRAATEPSLNTYGLWHNVGAYIYAGHTEDYWLQLFVDAGGLKASFKRGDTVNKTGVTLVHSGNIGDYAPLSYGAVGANYAKGNWLGYSYGTEDHGGGYAGGVISAGIASYGVQINGRYTDGALKVRGYSADSFTEWKTVAFTDSDITGNAATSTLARNLTTTGNVKYAYASDVSAYAVFGVPEYNTYIDGDNIRFRYGSSQALGMLIDRAGKVTLYAGLNIGSTAIYGGSDSQEMIHHNGSNLLIGQGVAKAGNNTVIYGNAIYFAYGTAGSISNTALLVNSDGNVGIGSVSPAQKLDVAGYSITNGLYIRHNSDAITASGCFLLQYYTPSNKLLALTSRSTNYSQKTFLLTADWDTGNIGLKGLASTIYNVYVTGSVGITGATTINNTLAVSGNATVGGSLKIGDATIIWDATNKVLKIDKPLATTGYAAGASATAN